MSTADHDADGVADGPEPDAPASDGWSAVDRLLGREGAGPAAPVRPSSLPPEDLPASVRPDPAVPPHAPSPVPPSRTTTPPRAEPRPVPDRRPAPDRTPAPDHAASGPWAAPSSSGPGPYGAPPPTDGRPWEGMAVAALVSSVVSLFCLFFLGPVAVVLGVRAFRRITVNGKKGRGMALAGVVVGGFSSFIGVLFVLGRLADSGVM